MAYTRYNDKNFLQFSSDGKAVGVFMKPRDTDEGLCVPQSVDGPCFRTATPVDNNPQVRKDLYNAIQARITSDSTHAKWYNELLSTMGTAHVGEDSLYENTKEMLGGWSYMVKPGDKGTEIQSSYHYGAHKCITHPSFNSSSGYKNMHPRSWNMGEFTYAGYVMPYNSTSGFVQHSWIPSREHLLMQGDSMTVSDMYYHTYRKNYDNNDMNVSHMLALGGTVFEDYCCAGLISSINSTSNGPLYMLAAIPSKLLNSDRITAWVEDPATGKCIQNTYLTNNASGTSFTRNTSMTVDGVTYWVLGRCVYSGSSTNTGSTTLTKKVTVHITKFHTQGDTCDGTTDLY